MTRQRIDYWRAFHGLPFDERWRGIAEGVGCAPHAVFHVAMCLMDAGSRSKPRGTVKAPPTVDIAEATGLSVVAVQATVELLRMHGFIEGDRLTDWRRQPAREDRGAAERKRNQRAREAVQPASAPAWNGERVRGGA